MASEGRAAARAQASTAASPPFLLAPTASATAPSSPSSLHLISLPPHERSNCHRLLAPVVRASSRRISSAHVLPYRRRGARGAVSIEVLAIFSLLTALSHFAASPPSPPSPPRLISRSSSLASRRWLHGRRCRSNRRSSRWCSSRWCSSRSSSRRRCRCRGARSSRHARLILCACVCGGVFACDAAINYLRHRYSLAAPASRRSAAA